MLRLHHTQLFFIKVCHFLPLFGTKFAELQAVVGGLDRVQISRSFDFSFLPPLIENMIHFKLEFEAVKSVILMSW